MTPERLEEIKRISVDPNWCRLGAHETLAIVIELLEEIDRLTSPRPEIGSGTAWPEGAPGIDKVADIVMSHTELRGGEARTVAAVMVGWLESELACRLTAPARVEISEEERAVVEAALYWLENDGGEPALYAACSALAAAKAREGGRTMVDRNVPIVIPEPTPEERKQIKDRAAKEVHWGTIRDRVIDETLAWARSRFLTMRTGG